VLCVAYCRLHLSSGVLCYVFWYYSCTMLSFVFFLSFLCVPSCLLECDTVTEHVSLFWVCCVLWSCGRSFLCCSCSWFQYGVSQIMIHNRMQTIRAHFAGLQNTRNKYKFSLSLRLMFCVMWCCVVYKNLIAAWLFMVACLAYSSIPTMVVVGSSETSVNIYYTASHPRDYTVHNQDRGYLKFMPCSAILTGVIMLHSHIYLWLSKSFCWTLAAFSVS
jgi:hypothetical protein